jgi:predicted dehydrogenase
VAYHHMEGQAVNRLSYSTDHPEAGMTGRKLRLCLATLEHDHAWWTLGHLLEADGVTVAGVADGDESRRHRAAAMLPPRTPLFTDVETMLDGAGPELDGLVVTAPNSEHRALVEAAAGRGVACMVQKPMATSYADALAMSQSAERAGVVLMVNYFPLWQPQKAELFRRVRAGGIGAVRQLTVMNGHQGPRGISVLSEDYQRWLYDPVRHGGGALMDQATYGIAYATWMLGRPGSVLALQTPVRHLETGGVDDMCTVVLSYPGAQAQVMGSWAWPHRLEVVQCLGSEGSISLAEGRVTLRRAAASIDDEPEAKVLDPAPAGAGDAARSGPRHGVEHFAAVLRDGGPVDEPHSGVMNVLVSEVTEAAVRSARDGRSVSLG